MKAKKSSAKPKKHSNNIVSNGLADAILGNTDGFGPGQSIGVQLSQVDTLFKNNRWYLVSNFRQLLSEIYVEHGIIQTIIDVPVEDGLRGGVEIKTKQLSPEQIADIQSEMDREQDLVKVAQANKWNRLFGGGGILTITDQDSSMPLNVEALYGSPLAFRSVDMWELFWTKQNTSDYSAVIDGPDLIEGEWYDYYGKQVHTTRVMKMIGIEAPSFIRPRLRGWGVSKVETLVRSLNQYLKSTNLVFEVLDEFKVDVYKIKNLTNSLLSSGGETQIRKRIQLANQQKNFQNAITMDGEDDFIQKELSFAGLAETMAGIRMQIASDMRMPLTKLFGISATGFNSGEDDIENYNAMVESEVRNKCKYEIIRMIELRCMKNFGFIPDDLSIGFKPLRMLSAEQEENVKSQMFNRVLQAKQANEITSLEFRDAVNKANLLPIQLDTTAAAMGEIEEQQDADADSELNDEGKAGEKPKGSGPKSTLTAKKAPEVKNSLEYDIAAYETDGGDGQYLDHHERDFEMAQKLDRNLVMKGKEMSMKAFGKEKWQFVLWYYKQNGGKFR